MRSCRWLLFVALTASLTPARADVTIYAAASLAPVLDALWPRTRHPEVRVSYASSGLLARQISRGAPADVYLSAHPAWMDTLQSQGWIDSASRRDVATNRLVWVTHDSTLHPPLAGDGTVLVAWLRQRGSRLAIADPGHVPAGIYAQQALRNLGWWTALAPVTASGADVRAALAFVARGACDLGIVYASDVTNQSAVHGLAVLADSLHAPVRYPAALVRGADERARQLLDTLSSPPVRALWTAHGFGDGDPAR